MGKLKDWFQNRKAQRELNKQEPLEKLDTISNNNATGETPDGDTWTPEGGFDLETVQKSFLDISGGFRLHPRNF